MRVLVCGSRDFVDKALLFHALDNLARTDAIDCIIEGDCRGADRLAGFWARKHRIDNRKFPADWHEYGGKAGHIRNQKMLDEGKPDLVLAFPLKSSRGTWDMVNRARRAGIRVEVIT